MKKAILAASLAALTTVGLVLGGCSAPNSSTDGSSQASSAAPGAASDKTVTITDHAGNSVEIPANIERIAVDEIPIASTYLAYNDGKAPKLIGMSQSVVGALKDTVVPEMAPELMDVETNYFENGELNVEALLNIKPDVVFYNANNTEHYEQFKAAGIPAVGFSTQGDPTQVYADWLRLLEQVFQEPGKMDEKIAYGRQLIDDAKKRSAQVSEAERKRALIIFNYSNGTARVAGDTPFFGYYGLQTANAKNAAEGTSQGLAPVNAEQILAWDPDVVLIGGAGQANLTVDQVLNNSAEGLDLSGLRAVKDKQVYSNELGMWSWFTPNPDAPLVANWLGKTLYPDEFSDVDLVKQVKEYYKLIYNFDLSDDQAQDILRGPTS